MSLRLSTQKICNKGSSRLNEDALLVKGQLFAVFDGATSLVPFVDKRGKTGGKLASEITREAFAENERSLIDLAKTANSRILSRMQKEGIDTRLKENLWCVAAATVNFTDREMEFFQIGDCFILLILKDGSFKLLVDVADRDLETMIFWKKLSDQKTDDIRIKLSAKINQVRRKTNVTYGALNGEKEAEKFFNLGGTKVDQVKSVILFTDGLLIPKENPESREDWELFVTIYQKRGLSGLLNHIRSIEKTDPNCWQYPRFKKHDDVAAIGIDFQAQ